MIDFSDFGAIAGKVNTTVNTVVTPQVTNAKPKLTIDTTSSKAILALEKCLVFLNNERLAGYQEKQQAYDYVRDAIAYFTANEPSRLVNTNIPDIHEISTIEITMVEKTQWIYGTDSSKRVELRDRKLPQDSKESKYYDAIASGKVKPGSEIIDLAPKVSRAKWRNVKVTQKSSKAKLNRKKTAFEIGMISAPSQVENAITMNGKLEECIYFGLYEHLPIFDNELTIYDPGYVSYSQNKQFCPNVVHIKVNGKWIVSGITKLTNAQLETGKQKFTKVTEGRKYVDKFRSGLVDNWSLPFRVDLQKDDYLYSEANKSLTLQVCIESDRLVLYKLGNSYTRSLTDETSSPYAGITQLSGKKIQSLNMTQDRVKLLDLAVLTVSTFDVYQWIASKPQYEKLAITLQKYGKLPSDIQALYDGIRLWDDKLTIGDRVLCYKKHIGKRPLTKVTLLTKYTDASGVLPQYAWLDAIAKLAYKKMIGNNTQLIADKLGNHDLHDQDRQKLIDQRHNLKTLLKTISKAVSSINPDMSDRNLTELSSILGEYLICKLSLPRYEIIGMMKTLEQDSYNKLLANARQYYDCKDGSHLNETKLTSKHDSKDVSLVLYK